ncbi:hypothetical protein [Clostridium pasteurianum]|uniref:Uncharacterized protein n=1 Tax=Clostridium pasteurianum BC1 TaxID=86416 RepID=R4K716_CLOPA|nr:hypothetical protein [Clostridium pasteurianum]AGK96319.1 hypothetical protein Clopa_1334 [Clostridium pasteurianum BC1]
MSKCKKHEEIEHREIIGVPVGVGGGSSCACSLPALIVLILIILQFSKKGGTHKKIDKGILFIIALFYLSCANPCKNGLY